MAKSTRAKGILGFRSDEGAASDVRRRFAEGGVLLATPLALIALVLSFIGAAGWIFDIPGLRQVYAAWPAMQPNTALGLILGVVAVLLSQSTLRTRFRLLVICSLATIVLLLGSATLSEYFFRWNIGLDRLFVHEQPTLANPYPGRPSPQTSLNFALLGASLLLRQRSRLPDSPARIGPLAQVGALLVLANALVALTGYIFGVDAFYQFPFYAAHTGMSLPTALAFVSLSLAFIYSRPNEGVMTLLTSEGVSSAIARRIVLILIVGWPLIGALTMLGANAGWYDRTLAASLFSLIMLGLLLWNTWRAAWHGNQIELSRRAAEDELEIAATRIRNLVEQGSDGIFVSDLEGRYTNVNSAGCRMFGYAREEIVGKTILDLILPEDIPRLMQHRERLLRGDAEIGEWIVRRKDGTRFPVEVSAKILSDGQWEAFVRDITERKRIERNLRFSEAKFSGILAVSADAKILIDRNQHIVMFNAGAQKIFGYSETEAMNQPVDILIPERLRRAHRNHVEQFAAGPDRSRPMKTRGDVFGLRKNGEEFPADAAISKLTVDGESILTVSLRDITDQKRVESEQRFLSEAGAEFSSSLGYEDTLEHIANMAVRGIADVCIVDIPAADRKPGLRKVAGRDPAEKDVCDALARAPFDPSYLTPSISSARRPVIEQDLTPERLMSLAGGETALQAWRALDLKSMIAIPLAAQGKVVAVVALLSRGILQARDVLLAEELGLRATMALANALLCRELQQEIRGREDMLAIVSHDLGNPLASISIVAKLLRRADSVRSDKLNEYLSAIETSTGQMRRLITDLLDFSRIQSGTFSVRSAAETATDVIASAVKSVRNQAEARQQALTVDVPETLPEIFCDKHRIIQVLSNLLGNAIKFTPDGGAIGVAARIKGDELVISVSDTGPGIPPEDLPRIFDRYWQAEGAKGGGAGLGLAIAKGIVESHGGRIWAESQIGVGSTFRFAVPLGRAALSNPERLRRASSRVGG